MSITSLIEDFDKCLADNCSYIYQSFNQPLSDFEIDSYMKKLGVDIDDFKDVYKWKNGVDMDSQDYSIESRIVYAGNFVSLKNSLTIKKKNSGILWDDSMIPIMASYEGEYLLLYTDKFSEKFGYVFFFSTNLGYSEPITCYDSFPLMLQTIIELFKNKAQWYDYNNKYLNFDFDMVAEVSRRLNPRSDEWK